MSSDRSPATKRALAQLKKGENLDQTVGEHGSKVRVVEETRGAKAILKVPSSAPSRPYEREPVCRVRGPGGEILEDRVEYVMNEAVKASLLRLQGADPLSDEKDEDDRTTVGQLIEQFREDELPHKSEVRRDAAERHLECFEGFLKKEGDWTTAARDIGVPLLRKFWHERRKGILGPRGEVVAEDDRKEVSRTTASGYVAEVRHLYSWASGIMRGGEPIVTWNPGTHVELPRNPNPNRPLCSDEKFEAMLKAAREQPVMVGHEEQGPKRRAPFAEIWLLAGYTGHRVGAILSLKWDDWRPDVASHGALRWRAESDKVENEHLVPVHPQVAEALEAWRKEQMASDGEMSEWIFPAAEADGPIRTDVAGSWLLTVEKRAGYEHPKGFGFHALRRRWAMKRKSLSPVDVAEGGGWKNLETLQQVYQTADLETMEKVVMAGESE